MKKLSNYNCLKCSKLVTIYFGSGKFCSRSCANKKEMTEQKRANISKGVKNCKAYLNGTISPNKGTGKCFILKKCIICNAEFTPKKNNPERKTCYDKLKKCQYANSGRI